MVVPQAKTSSGRQPAAVKKEFSRSAQEKRVAARWSSVCKVNPQRGPTSKDLIAQKTPQIKQASTAELQKQTFTESWRSREISG